MNRLHRAGLALTLSLVLGAPSAFAAAQPRSTRAERESAIARAARTLRQFILHVLDTPTMPPPIPRDPEIQDTPTMPPPVLDVPKP
jgi:hypothetical protein